MTSINVKKYLCNTCNNIYDLYDMIVPPRQKPTQCKNCSNIYKREWHKNNKQRKKSSRLKSRYGITIEQYNDLLKKQNGVCALCYKEDMRPLSVDHNHKTKKIRALLCFKCNVLLGFINEDLDHLERVRDYLLKYLNFENEYLHSLEIKNA